MLAFIASATRRWLLRQQALGGSGTKHHGRDIWRSAFATAIAVGVPIGACAAVGSHAHPGTLRRPPILSAEYLPLHHLRAGLTWAAHVDLEGVANLSGGLEREATVDLAAQAGFGLDTRLSGWWPGGLFTATVLAVTSGRPSSDTAGDIQGVDNLAAASRVRLYELNYRQHVTHVADLRVGLMDLNYHFAVVGVASTLINSSFGILPTLSANVPVAIYPYAGVGAMAALHGYGAALRLGVFQGDPSRPEAFFDRGYLALAEGGWYARQRAFGLKVGVWRYVSGRAGPGSSDTGMYTIAEGRWRLASGGRLGVFLQYGTSTRGTDPVPRYVGMGMRWQGPFRGRSADLFSVGVARAWVRGARAETAYEVTYALRLHYDVYLQPDLQYVVHPGGSSLADALVGIVRIHVEFF